VSRRLGTQTAGGRAPAVRLDNNVGSYSVERDGRSGEGRTQHVRIDRIEASPFQVRKVFSEGEIETLAESVRQNGLIHEPKGRPHPVRPGWTELMPGEMRLRALKRLVETGRAEGVLTRDSEGHWLVPIRIEAVDDERAEAIVWSENLDRSDLSAWEWALAWEQRRGVMRRTNPAVGLREVAASLGRPYQTVAEYLRVADHVTPAVLDAAGVTGPDAEPDHQRMAKLSLAALKRVADAAEKRPRSAPAVLLHELARVDDSAAGDRLALQKQERRQRDVRRTTFQVNIRTPLGELTPRQAAGYLGRIAPVVAVLAEQAAGEMDAAQARPLVAELEAALARLRGSG
jgi:ParB-like chromosome segregation protein Spo0J